MVDYSTSYPSFMKYISRRKDVDHSCDQLKILHTELLDLCMKKDARIQRTSDCVVVHPSNNSNGFIQKDEEHDKWNESGFVNAIFSRKRNWKKRRPFFGNSTTSSSQPFVDTTAKNVITNEDDFHIPGNSSTNYVSPTTSKKLDDQINEEKMLALKRQFENAYRSIAATRAYSCNLSGNQVIIAEHLEGSGHTDHDNNNNNTDTRDDEYNHAWSNQQTSVPSYFTDEEVTEIVSIRENRVIHLIHQIGDAVIRSERSTCLPVQQPTIEGQYTSPSRVLPSLRSDDVFEYFCEKNVLALFVDIVKTNPTSIGNSSDNASKFCGLVWSTKVKKQVYITISKLITNIRDYSALFYILSQHCINQLLFSMLPLKQFTIQSLEEILPVYVDFMKTLVFQLTSNAEALFPFFIVNMHESTKQKHLDENNDDNIDSNDTSDFFPLFSAIVSVLNSSYAQSNSFVHASCLNLIVGVLQIQHPSVRNFLNKTCSTNDSGDTTSRSIRYSNSLRDHIYLTNHMSAVLINIFNKIVNLTTGPVVDIQRSKAIDILLENDLKHHIDALNDIFFCNVHTLNARMCEVLISQFIIPILLIDNIIPSAHRQFLIVGIDDTDVIPECEAKVQVSVFILSKLLSMLEYGPFVRMIAVLLFHPISSLRLRALDPDENVEFTATLTLNSIVQGTIDSDDVIPNPFRVECFKSLSGVHGELRTISAIHVVTSTLTSAYINFEILRKLHVLPHYDVLHQNNPHDIYASRPSTELEDSLMNFLNLPHVPKSNILTVTIQYVTSLSLQYLYKCTLSSRSGNDDYLSQLKVTSTESPLRIALNKTREHFYHKVLESLDAVGSNSSFVDIVEGVVQKLYKKFTKKDLTSGAIVFGYAYHLYQNNVTNFIAMNHSECLVRKNRSGIVWNEIERLRFYSFMAFHLRAVCKVIDKYDAEVAHYCSRMDENDNNETVVPVMRLIDEVDELKNIFSCLAMKPSYGTDIHLDGRMTFHFNTVKPIHDLEGEDILSSNDRNGNSKYSGDGGISSKSAALVLVLDPTDIFIVKPVVARTSKSSPRGTVICCIPLMNVIASGHDGGTCLHMAVRNEESYCYDHQYGGTNPEQIRHLIRNGNIIFQFDSAGTCLIVKQYMDRIRNQLKQDLFNGIQTLFKVNVDEPTNSSMTTTIVDVDEESKKRVKERVKS